MADIHHITTDPLSQSEATTPSKIPALNEDGSNWVLYKAQFLAAVQAKGLRRYLEGRERVPQPTTAPGVDSDADERYETAVDKWLGNHSAIKTLLFQTVPEPLKLEITTKTCAVDAWAVVTAKYDNQGDFVQVSILHRMQQLRCEEGGDPRPVLAQLARLRSEYATAGGVLSDEQYKVLIIGLLPPSYCTSVCAIQLTTQVTGQVLTVTALLSVINLLARDEHTLDADPASASALAAANARYYNCQKLGHFAADCRAKGGSKEGQGKEGGKSRRRRLRKKK